MLGTGIRVPEPRLPARLARCKASLTSRALAGIVVLTAIIVAFIVEVTRGQDGTPYSLLGAIGGLSYLLAVVGLRLRGQSARQVVASAGSDQRRSG